MDKLSGIIDTVRLTLNLAAPSYLSDHQVGGRAVLPAVEIMHLLAKAVKEYRADIDVTEMADTRFDKFLYLAPGQDRISAFVDIRTFANGDVTASLLTKHQAKTSAITRTKEHAVVRFPCARTNCAAPAIDLSAALEGVCLAVTAEKIYRELVPFGPAYQNLRQRVFVSESGALAEIGSPAAHEVPPDLLLGSPFPLDAAYHAACVWGQRFAGAVAFPVGFEQRRLFLATQPGERYYCRIDPVEIHAAALIVDIHIYDESGRLRECSLGVRMRDVSGGRVRPPQWIVAKNQKEPLAGINGRCRATAVIELETLLPFAASALSVQENGRLQELGVRRRRSYLSARLVCKRIVRKLSPADRVRPADEITTIAPDGVRPACPQTSNDAGFFCSVSHDDRFAVAVAADSRLGVDVERISRRVLSAGRLYMSDAEQAIVKRSTLGEIEAAVRVWTIKEAVVKSLNISLADAWQRVQVVAIGRDRSRLRIDGRPVPDAVHDRVGRHVFTVAGVADSIDA